MNRHPENGHERHIVNPRTWNLNAVNPPTTVQLTNCVILDHVFALPRMLCGTEAADGLPSLDASWGDDHRQILESWLDIDLVDDDMKFELGLSNEGGAGNYEEQLAE